MGSWSSPKAKRLIGALTLGLVGAFASACGGGKPAGVDGDPDHGGLIGSDRCATPNVGCACATTGKVVECGTVQREAEGQLWCSVGHRTCASDGKWSDCEVEDLRVLPAPERGVRPQALGIAGACVEKPCDPFCQQVTDSGTDLTLPDGFAESGNGGITLIAKQGDLNDSACTGIRVVPDEATLTVVGLTSGGHGLRGEYFPQRYFDDGGQRIVAPQGAVPAFTRIDAELNFDWPGSPGAPIGADEFTVRWTGSLRPPTTDSYELCVSIDDGAILTVDDNVVVSDWFDQPEGEHCSAPLALTANLLYPLQLDYYESGGLAALRLRWRHSGAPAGEIIPTTALVPPAGETLTTLEVEPPFAQFQAFAVPDGCFEGPLDAAWTVDRLDRSRIDNAGRLSLLAPVAGDIAVTAYVGNFQGSAIAHVGVDVVDTEGAPPGAVEAFDEAPGAADDVAIVYPYAETVFPLALRAPTVQWDSATTAEAVKVSVRYPFDGDAIYSWSKIMSEPAPGRFAVPQSVWANLEASAKGNAAGIEVERVVAGARLQGTSRPIQFAEAPLRGKIYYTQYGRNGSTNIMVADPGSPESARPVFASEAATGNKCPVCHSMSANGTMFATADRSFSINGGLSRVDPATGVFSALSDYSTEAAYRVASQDFRGFAWAAITPDGKYALAANNIWGNSREQLVGITQPPQAVTPTQTVIQPAGVVSGGSGTGLLARYFLNNVATGWDWRRVDPKVDFNWGAAAPGGPVPTAFSSTWTGQVQAYTTETYTFRVTATGGVRLSVNGTTLIDDLAHNTLVPEALTGNIALTRGAKTAISLEYRNTGASNQVTLGWSSPAIAYGVIPQTQLYPNDGVHGVVATYYRNTDFTAPFITDRLEANVNADWGGFGPRPMPAGSDDSWSVSYRGRFEVPVSGNMELCVSHDDGATVLVDGTERYSATGVVALGCTAPFAVTSGQLRPFEVRLVEGTGNAHVRLYWRISGTLPQEIIPSSRLRPPAAWTAPANGLSVTYYDTETFNSGSAASAGTLATSRIEPTIDLDWLQSRPEHSSALTDSDYFSARFTGRLNAPCEGDYDFQVVGNEGGRLYLDGERVTNLWGANITREGTKYLTAGMHDIKLDHQELTNNARISLRWKPHCQNAVSYGVIPSANLLPGGDAGTNGYFLAGGDNPSDTSYFIWALPANAGQPPLDVSNEDPQKPDRWGLGGTTMMVPSFSPDGSKLVFIDGDSAAGNGWRKGLSTFDFDQEGKLFSNRRTIVSTFPYGDVMKWPVFESDSRSVIYQATVPADRCCFNNWKLYGFMGPTNYFEDPGRLFSVDTAAAAPAPVELKRLNEGERPMDRNKAYQATMLPQASAGYRWAVFTSTRPYGNTLNLAAQKDFSDPANYSRITEPGKIQSMLWVSAIDDAASAATDRSHPAFFLPNQSFSEDAASGFLNERAYWVKDACRPAGTSAASACDVDEDCCGAEEGLAVCRIDTGAISPVTRHCFNLPTGDSCVQAGMACTANEECCSNASIGQHICDDGICAKPPSLARYAPANYSRIYESSCGPGTQVQWMAFEYKASVPEVGGQLQFYAESADDPADFHTLPASPTGVDTTMGIVHLGDQGSPGEPTKWIPIAVSTRLEEQEVVPRKFLKITIRFVPNQDRLTAPVLTDWRQIFSCPPAE